MDGIRHVQACGRIPRLCIRNSLAIPRRSSATCRRPAATVTERRASRSQQDGVTPACGGGPRGRSAGAGAVERSCVITSSRRKRAPRSAAEHDSDSRLDRCHPSPSGNPGPWSGRDSWTGHSKARAAAARCPCLATPGGSLPERQRGERGEGGIGGERLGGGLANVPLSPENRGEPTTETGLGRRAAWVDKGLDGRAEMGYAIDAFDKYYYRKQRSNGRSAATSAPGKLGWNQ